jgi:hypothetical protein
LAVGAIAGAALSLAACTGLVGSFAADTLASAILNQDDPALIESGVPS